MDEKAVREKTRKMLATFIDSIGLDGEGYSQINETPWLYEKACKRCGKFLTPGSEKLNEYFEIRKFNDIMRKIFSETGIILINKSYLNCEPDADLYVTLVHETLHANRDLLLFDAFREGKNELAYSNNNGRFEQNTEKLSSNNVDASQDIFKGSIDTSRAVVDSYASMTSKEIENIDWTENKIGAQMEKQRRIDESLIEIMARLSYVLYRDKQKGKDSNIWDIIQGIRENSKEEYYELRAEDSEFEFSAEDTILAKDRAVMCDILLKHHDFELFNWMIDPISYSQGDIHYDFFGQYTKDDTELLEKLYEDKGKIDLDDEYSLDSTDVGGITTPDIKKVVTSKTAIEELSSSFEDIKQAQTQSREDNERM